MEWTYQYFLGVLAAGLITLLIKRVVDKQLTGKGDRRTKRPLYRSDHIVLNIPLPPQSMWMNMGFWKVRYDHFEIPRVMLIGIGY
jgi:hypothetical protein